MRWPLDSFTVTQGFKPGHLGTDLGADAGTPIKAPDSGVVIAILSNWKPGGYFGGNFVKVKGDSGYTFYMGHMSKTKTKLNARIKEGQVIGQVGATGQATGPHIHYELSKGGVMYDAEEVMKKEVQMASKTGVHRITRLRLWRGATAAEVAKYAGKFTDDQVDASICKTTEYKKHVVSVKKNKSISVGALGIEFRKSFGSK